MPTKAQVEFVYAISGYVRYELPVGAVDELWFVEAFLDTFAYGSRANQTPRREVRRRCSIARDFVADGRPSHELGEKLQVAAPQAEVLFDYAIQRLENTWWKRSKNSAEAFSDGDVDDESEHGDGCQLDGEWYEQSGGEASELTSLPLDEVMTRFQRATEELASELEPADYR